VDDAARGVSPLALVRTKLAPPEVLAAIGAAWALVLAAQALGRAESVHHDELFEGGLPVWAALALFVLAWQVMIAAMMLPSSLPFIRLFARASSSQPRPALARAAFLGGYAAVWTAFGLAAFLGDGLVHAAVERSAWLEQRPWLIAGGVLVLAGGFQFSSLKDACLKECRHPAAFLLRFYRRGTSEAFGIGLRHGAFCLGCCWALMLVGFAAGVVSLWWMGVLTLLMVFEKTGRHGKRGAAPIGAALLILGALVLAHPGWMPEVF
jgi:predicted metal-binding membrane protein